MEATTRMVSIGEKVRHPKMPEWGIGKVLDVTFDNKARVFFIHAGEKVLSLKIVTLEVVEGESSAHPILDHPTFAARTAKEKSHKSLPDAQRDFLRFFPRGFEDPQYFKEERDYKVEAGKLLQTLLNQDEFVRLLRDQDFEEIARRALQVANKTNLIFPNEKMSLKDGLKTPENVRIFAESLYELLYGKEPFRTRFEAFAHCLERIGAAKWTTATYFPFLAFPEEHMFLKPEVTKHAAELTKAELNYKSELNWLTYSSLLGFAKYLRQELQTMEMKPCDMIDVQSFMWCITPGKYDWAESGAFAGTKEDFKRVLRRLDADGYLKSTKYGELLKAQYESEGHTTTATLMAEAVGYANYNAVNLQYGTMARVVAEYLGYLPPKRANGERMWWCTLSDGNDASDSTIDGHFEFVMRPELATALEELHWVKPKD